MSNIEYKPRKSRAEEECTETDGRVSIVEMRNTFSESAWHAAFTTLRFLVRVKCHEVGDEFFIDLSQVRMCVC